MSAAAELVAGLHRAAAGARLTVLELQSELAVGYPGLQTLLRRVRR